MKTTNLSNEQAAHLWAAQQVTSGKAGNFYFEGSILYSYGPHYVVGRMYKTKTGKQYALMNSRKSTMTTECKHKNAARNALTGRCDFISVPAPDNALDPANELHLMNNIADTIADLWNLKTRVVYLESVNNAVNELNLFYKLTGQRKSFSLDRMTFNDLVEIEKQKHLKMNAAALRKAEAEKRIEEQEREEFKHQVQLWPSHQNTKMIPWHAFPFDMIRLSSDGREVETSRGAKVPVKQALELLKKIKAGEAVTGFRVGGFTVDSEPDQTDKTLEIGCHKVNIEQAASILERAGNNSTAGRIEATEGV